MVSYGKLAVAMSAQRLRGGVMIAQALSFVSWIETQDDSWIQGPFEMRA